MKPAPRLAVRVLAMSFAKVAAVLAAAFLVISLDIRARVREAAVDKVRHAQQLFTHLEAQRQRDLLSMVSMLAENPTLKAAVDTYQAEAGQSSASALVATVERELMKLAARVPADVLAVADANGRIVAAAGRRASDWPSGMVSDRRVRDADGGEWLAQTAGAAFRVITVPIVLDEVTLGSLEIGVALDDAYARQLAELGRADSAIVVDGRLVATTLAGKEAEALVAAANRLRGQDATLVLGAHNWLLRPYLSVGLADFYTMTSPDRESAEATNDALAALALIGVGALVLAGIGSFWLSRTLARPIDELSAALGSMTSAGRVDRPLALTGSSREIDALVVAFNEMLAALARAEAQTEASYLGAIRALAAALDARDPYTSGHSERVSLLAVAIGRVMQLSDAELEVLRLGGLLHDIGKIGVPDHVLRKPASLTEEEFESIKMHPSIGARIVRSIPLLAAHVPIVELHHEQPDGSGYPFGLKGEAIPLVARIAHVADAYDAMTSARAYRPARLPQEAIAELVRHQGTGFDPEVVSALVTALPRLAHVGTADPGVMLWSWSKQPQSLAS